MGWLVTFLSIIGICLITNASGLGHRAGLFYSRVFIAPDTKRARHFVTGPGLYP
jgi:hypothetical protein